MIDILDHLARQRTKFVPRDRREYVALQLARRLNDEVAVGRYVGMAHSYPERLLAAAYRRLQPNPGDLLPALAYEAELQHGSYQGPGRTSPVLGVRIERRRIGLVLLKHGGIEYVETLELSSDAEKAIKSVEGLIRSVLPRIADATVAVERVEQPRESRRKELTTAAIVLLRTNGLSIWEVSRADLSLAAGNPPPPTAQGARQVAATLWPTLVGTGQQALLLDAAMVGLYVDITRQLSRDEGGSP